MKMPLSPLSPGSGAQLPIRTWRPVRKNSTVRPWGHTESYMSDVFDSFRFEASNNFSSSARVFPSADIQRARALGSLSQSAEEALVVVLAFKAKCIQMQYSATTSRKWWNQMMYVGCGWNLIQNWCSVGGLCNFAFASPSSAAVSAAASSPPSCGVRHDPFQSRSYQSPIESLSMLHQPKDSSKTGNPFVHPIKRAHLNASIQSVRSQTNLPTLPCSATWVSCIVIYT